MNVALKMMNFALKMVNVVLKMMSFIGRCAEAGTVRREACRGAGRRSDSARVDLAAYDAADCTADSRLPG